jgi:hypothetical protein
LREGVFGGNRLSRPTSDDRRPMTDDAAAADDDR